MARDFIYLADGRYKCKGTELTKHMRGKTASPLHLVDPLLLSRLIRELRISIRTAHTKHQVICKCKSEVNSHVLTLSQIFPSFYYSTIWFYNYFMGLHEFLNIQMLNHCCNYSCVYKSVEHGSTRLTCLERQRILNQRKFPTSRASNLRG